MFRRRSSTSRPRSNFTIAIVNFTCCAQGLLWHPASICRNSLGCVRDGARQRHCWLGLASKLDFEPWAALRPVKPLNSSSTPVGFQGAHQAKERLYVHAEPGARRCRPEVSFHSVTSKFGVQITSKTSYEFLPRQAKSFTVYKFVFLINLNQEAEFPKTLRQADAVIEADQKLGEAGSVRVGMVHTAAAAAALYSKWKDETGSTPIPRRYSTNLNSFFVLPVKSISHNPMQTFEDLVWSWKALLPRLVQSLWKLPCGFVDAELKVLLAKPAGPRYHKSHGVTLLNPKCPGERAVPVAAPTIAGNSLLQLCCTACQQKAFCAILEAIDSIKSSSCQVLSWRSGILCSLPKRGWKGFFLGHSCYS